MQKLKQDKFFSTAYDLASHYGFVNINNVINEHKTKRKSPKPKPIKIKTKGHKSDIIKLLDIYFSRGIHLEEKPLLVFHTNRAHNDKKVFNNKSEKKASMVLSVINIENAVAEAIILSCIKDIHTKFGSGKPKIKLNSIGCKVSSKTYFSELNSFIRKNIDSFTPQCANMCRESIYDAHKLLWDEGHSEIHSIMPNSIKYLSESSKKHFHNIIKHIESYNVDYELKHDIVEDPEHLDETVFVIESECGSINSKGGRYGNLANTLYRKYVPIVSFSITIDELVDDSDLVLPKKRKPKVFFLNTGDKARFNSLPIISDLFERRIPIAHRLYKTTVSDQLEGEPREMPFCLIYGQEENDNEVIKIKNNKTQSIRTISIKNELHKLKKYLQN